MKYLITICLILMCNTKISAQGYFPEDNGYALAGVKEFYAVIVNETWLNMNSDFQAFGSTMDNAFKSGLRRNGVTVTERSSLFLICSSRIIQNSGLVFYSLDVKLYRYRENNLNSLLLTRGRVGSVGSSRFNATELAGDCVDIFTSEWLKQNPRR